MKFRIKQGLFLLLVPLVIYSCRKDRGAKWDANFLIPLAKTTLNIDNLLGGFSTQGTNNNVDFVYAQELYNNSPALVEIPDTGITTAFTLNSLALANRTINRYITLGEINPVFNTLNGATLPIPAQSQNNLAPFDIDGSEFFETALLEEGQIVINFRNDLPVNIRSLTFDLRNKSDNSVIGSASFANVAPNTTATRIIDLAGKRVNAALEAKINTLDSDASNGPVLIEANKGIDIEISVQNLKAQEATAAFPNQTVINQDEELTQEFEGAELKFVKVRSGKLNLKLFTSIQEDMTLYLQIPSATKNGQFLDEVVKVKGATPGNPTVIDREINMEGYVIDYRGKNPAVRDTVNTFYQIMRVTLDSSGRKVDVSLSDSINIEYSLNSLVPDYAIGYMGTTTTETGNASQAFDIFDNISGNITLDDLIMRLKVSNGIGAEGSVLSRNITSVNTKTGNTIALTGPVINTEYAVSSAIFNPFLPQEQLVEFNKNNSNVKAFVENLPNQLNYNMKIDVSPNGNTNNWQDFLYFDSRFKVDLEMIVPGAFAAQNLTFRDSIDFDVASTENSEKIKGGLLNLFYKNSYPFSLGFKLALFSESGEFLDSLGTEQSFFPAAINGVVAEGLAELPIPESKVVSIRRAKYAHLILDLNTPNNSQVQLATNQECIVEIGADFIYELSTANNQN